MDLKPNYFDTNHEDGQTPSNTPSNKSKGTLNFNMNDLEFNKKVKKEIEDNSNDNEFKDNNAHKDPIYCKTIILGKLPLGHYLKEHNNNSKLNENTNKENEENVEELKTCCKLYCNRCNNKVTYIVDSKFKEIIKNNKPSIMKECLEPNNKYNSFSCKCSHISLCENKYINDLGYDWECDGHFL